MVGFAKSFYCQTQPCVEVRLGLTIEEKQKRGYREKEIRRKGVAKHTLTLVNCANWDLCG